MLYADDCRVGSCGGGVVEEIVLMAVVEKSGDGAARLLFRENKAINHIPK